MTIAFSILNRIVLQDKMSLREAAVHLAHAALALEILRDCQSVKDPAGRMNAYFKVGDTIQQWTREGKSGFMSCSDFQIVYPCAPDYDPRRKCETKHGFNTIADLRILVNAMIRSAVLDVDPHFKR